MDYREVYEQWLANPYFDDATKEELKNIAEEENEIKERFYMDLEFGTAGLRGIIGAGTNRMNIYVVRRATQGLANYIAKVGKQSQGVAIAYDSRHMSPEFAQEAALCLAANGIKAYIFESLRPTPELSFAVRHLGCVAGINITASHNPPEYNGYKVYWEDGALIKTIVTSNLADAIAKGYGVDLIEVLTGFKFIGQQILGFENSGKGTYLFGFEESYGCLIGTYARDKDAIVATMALCEAAAYYKTQGKTLWDAMIEMYDQYGYYKDDIKSITLKGIEGLQKIQEIMDTLRKNPPAEFAGHKVVSARDYKKDTITDLATGEVKPTGLPNSNVLYYDLTDDAWVCVRPSGTEPKVKFYYGVKGTSLEDADEKSAVMGKAVLDMVNTMM